MVTSIAFRTWMSENIGQNNLTGLLHLTNQHTRRSVCPKDLARDCFAIEVTKRNVSKTKPVFQAQWVCAVICSRHTRGTEADILATGSLYLYSSDYFDILDIRQY
jgi:hypothetical protein